MPREKQIDVMVHGVTLLAIRDAWHLTQQDFARVIGASREWVSRTEGSDHTFINRRILKGISTAMGLTPAEGSSLLLKLCFNAMSPDLIARMKPEDVTPKIPPLAMGMLRRDHSNFTPIGRRYADIPTLDASVAAGMPADIAEVADITDMDSVRQGKFRVVVSGESMTPDYLNGEIIELEYVAPEKVPVGQDYCVQLDDGTATFKRLESIVKKKYKFVAVNRTVCPEPIIVSQSKIVRLAICLGWFTPRNKRIE